MIKIARFIAALGVLLSMLTLVGCEQDFPFKAMQDSDKAVNNTAWKIGYNNKKMTTREPPVVVKPDYYVDTVGVDLQENAAWLNREINVQAQELPLDFVLARILRNTGATVDFQAGTDSSKTVNINYRGTIKGALDKIAASTNTTYRIQGKQLYWQAFVSRTFDVSFMPGTSSYLVGQGAGGVAASSASGSTSGSIATVSGNLGEQQYSSLQGDSLSVWKDLENTLNQLKSPAGKVAISEATTTVTVYDHPANVAAIAQYLEQFNRTMSREVMIQVEVVEIELNKNFNLGIDWDLVAGSFSLQGQAATAANISGTVSAGATANNALTKFILTRDNKQTLLQALSQQGKISVVTQPRVVTMNNQMAEIRITRDTSYLQSISTTIEGTSGAATTSLTPGVVTDGLSLYLLPKIQNDKVYLQISSSLATLAGLDTVNNKGVAAATTTNQQQEDAAIPDFQQIQVPRINEKHFNQRTVISSGATLVITGFQQLTNENNRTRFMGIQLLGGRGSEKQNIQTIVLITPTILGDV